MTKDWREQLRSDNPKIRAMAVKALAYSGDKDNLKYLREIVENDPDPQLREYARKGARHLYSTQIETEPEQIQQSPPIPEKTESEIVASLANPLPESEEDNLSNADSKEARAKVQRAYSLHTGGQTKKSLLIFGKALELDPDLEKDTFARSVAAEITGQSPEIALRTLRDPAELQAMIGSLKGKGIKTTQKTSSPTREQKRPQMDRSKSTLIQTWLSFFGMTEDLFQAEQEKANTEDTLLSVFVHTIAGVVIFMITGFFQIQQITTLLEEQLPELTVNLGMIFFFILIGTVILTPLTFYLSVGLQYLGVRMFGGTGDFKSHAFLMALVQVPATILGGVVSLLSFVPLVNFIAGLAGFALSIYTLVLTVRLIKVSHNVTTGKAIAGMIVPPIVMMVIGGCILMTLGSALGNIVNQLQ